MATTGGSIQEVSIKGRIFAVAADADANRDLGGFTNEVAPNGDGSARLLKTRKPWMIDGLALEIDDARADLEFLQGIANSSEFVPMTWTQVSGITYSAKGTITGDVKASTATATAPMTFSGPGEARQQ
jgi:hypothetical protein